MYKFKLLTDILDDNENIEKSKFFGSPIFPENFLEENKIEDDFFLLQINLHDYPNEYLPSNGFLYFFLNLSTVHPIPKVFYTNSELVEIYEDINEDFNMECCKALFLSENKDANNKIFEIENDQFVLLKIDVDDVPLSFPRFNLTHGIIKFVMNIEDLKNMNFSNVALILG